MTEYQTTLLTKHGFSLVDEQNEDWVLLIYKKSAEYGTVSVQSAVEVYDNIDPDLMSYQGTVAVTGNGKRLGGWDTGRRYKLLDVVAECDRFEGLVKKLQAYLTNKTD